MRNSSNYNVCLVVEGNEEDAFFEVVKKFGVSKKIQLFYINAGGFGAVAPYYQSAAGEEEYDCVLCVYDVDFKSEISDSPFNTIQNKLFRILGSKEKVNAISFCTNPNILQMILLCCDLLNNVSLISSSKLVNTPIVHKYWSDIGKNRKNAKGQKISANYTAAKWQLEKIKNSFVYNQYNYVDIFKNAVPLPCDYKNKNAPGSNLLPLLRALYDGDIIFFNKINECLDKK